MFIGLLVHFQTLQVQSSVSLLSVAMARASYDGNAISYVLSVLWMTSSFQSQRRRLRFVMLSRWQQQSHIRQHSLVEFAICGEDAVHD